MTPEQAPHYWVGDHGMATGGNVPEKPENRYVRVRCPICHLTSPVCDQQEDIRRSLLSEWWAAHLEVVHRRPAPIIERAEPPVVAVR